MSLFYESARVGLQARIDEARRPPQLHHHDLVNWRDQCLNINFTKWMNRSFQGPQRIRYNEICEEARNIPEWEAIKAVKQNHHKEMPRWLWISGIAVVTSATLAALAIRKYRSRRSSRRRRERDIEADADGGAPRMMISKPGSTDQRVFSFPAASEFPALSSVYSTSTLPSTAVSLPVDELDSEAEASVTNPLSVESEREELVEEERSDRDDDDDDDDDDDGDGDDDDDDDDDETESLQAASKGSDHKYIKSNGSKDEQIKAVTINKFKRKDTGKET